MKRIIAVPVLIALFLCSCSSTNISNSDQYMSTLTSKDYGEWIEYGSGTATDDNQLMTSMQGQTIENVFNAKLSIGIKKAIELELGYTLSISNTTLTGTSTTINKGQSIVFYYRKAYGNVEVKNLSKNSNATSTVRCELPPEYAWVVKDENGNKIKDTRNNLIPSYEDYPKIPDFGKLCGYEPIFEQKNTDPTLYLYHIKLERISVDIDKYVDELEKQGFVIKEKNKNNRNNIDVMIATCENITISIRIAEGDADNVDLPLSERTNGLLIYITKQ